MQLEHSFDVAAAIEDTWRVLLDAERVAECVPGATVESFGGDSATGSLKIRFGSLGPTYRGIAKITDKDPVAYRAVIEAVADTPAHGTAAAHIELALEEVDGVTRIRVTSQVELTGRAAELDAKLVRNAGDRLAKHLTAGLTALLTEAPRPVAAQPQPQPQPPPETSIAPEPPAGSPVRTDLGIPLRRVLPAVPLVVVAVVVIHRRRRRHSR